MVQNLLNRTVYKNSGSDSYEDQVKFIEEKFEAMNANPDKTLYMHQTCATDTNQVN